MVRHVHLQGAKEVLATSQRSTAFLKLKAPEERLISARAPSRFKHNHLMSLHGRDDDVGVAVPEISLEALPLGS